MRGLGKAALALVLLLAAVSAAYSGSGKAEPSFAVVIDGKETSDDPAITYHEERKTSPDFSLSWLEIKPVPGRKIFIDKIVLFRFKPSSEPQTFDGPGQPVYVGDTFYSVAYPSAETYFDGEYVVGEYKVGLVVGDEGYISHPAVVGTAEPGKVREAFYACVESMRAHPTRPFLLWNTWYDFYNYTDQDVIGGVEEYKELFLDPYGVKLDSVVLDDGWDDWFTLWSPHRRRFPQGFTPVVEAIKTIDSHLGLWMSPIGGYGTNVQARIIGTLGQGYEKNYPSFCFAGEKYNRAFTARMIEYERDFGVNYFKLDNLSAVCPRPGHGHRAGKYAREGLTDAFIHTLEQTRAQNPEVLINFTVGSWLSPWWLRWADVVWRGGWDYQFAGPGSKRQQSITYVDKILYQRLRVEKAQFPLNSLMTHGVIKGKRESLGETGENVRDFSDDVWMYFARGLQMQELYLTPGMLSVKERDVLASAIKWSRENWDILGDPASEMIGGDPDKGEVYGFLHQGERGSIMAMRNPSGQPASMIAMPEDSACEPVYSSDGQGFQDPLGPLGVIILSCPP